MSNFDDLFDAQPRQEQEDHPFDKDAWAEEFAGVDELYAKFGDRLPQELADELASVRAAFEK